MKAELEKIYESAKNDIEKAQTISDIDEIRLKYLSRKGEFNAIKKGLKDLTDEEKRTVGAFANQITEDLESRLKTKYDNFYQNNKSCRRYSRIPYQMHRFFHLHEYNTCRPFSNL